MESYSMCDCEFKKAFTIDKYFAIENCSCEKHLLGKLVLACEDEILNRPKTSFDDKKTTSEKSIALLTRFHW